MGKSAKSSAAKSVNKSAELKPKPRIKGGRCGKRPAPWPDKKGCFFCGGPHWGSACKALNEAKVAGKIRRSEQNRLQHALFALWKKQGRPVLT